MKGFAIVTAAVLAVIGIGVGLVDGLPRTVACAEQCGPPFALAEVLPTTGGTYRPASAAVVQHFLAEAHRDDQGFVATYRFLKVGTVPQTFLVAQEPYAAVLGAVFMYLAHEGGGSLKFLQLTRGTYECLRTGQHRPWSCEGPVPYVSNGIILASLRFDEPMALVAYMPAPPSQATTWSGTLHGLRVTCLRYLAVGARTTWCITADGITVFAASAGLQSVEVVKLSMSVPASDFVLPARSGGWHRLEYLP